LVHETIKVTPSYRLHDADTSMKESVVQLVIQLDGFMMVVVSNKEDVIYLFSNMNWNIYYLRYIYMNSTEHLFKILKDKQKEKEIKSFIRNPQLIKSGTKVNEDVIIECNNSKLLSLMNL